jgi:hypothetical protein
MKFHPNCLSNSEDETCEGDEWIRKHALPKINFIHLEYIQHKIKIRQTAYLLFDVRDDATQNICEGHLHMLCKSWLLTQTVPRSQWCVEFINMFSIMYLIP